MTIASALIAKEYFVANYNKLTKLFKSGSDYEYTKFYFGPPESFHSNKQ